MPFSRIRLTAAVLLMCGGGAAAVAPRGVAALAYAPPAYRAERTGEVVTLQDARAQTVVSIIPSSGNKAFEMKVKGQNVLCLPYASIEDFKAKGAGGFNGIPFLGPWANRLDEQAFYANGQRYAFDMQLGNVRGAIPIHGLVTTTNQWQVVEVKSDGKSAWVTSRLEFYKNPAWMKQFPFAHTIDMTYRLQDGVLQVTTQIANLSTDPMPVAIGFHPYFQLTDSKRERLDRFDRRQVAVASCAEQGADRRDRTDREAVPRSASDSVEGLRSRSRLRRSRARR